MALFKKETEEWELVSDDYLDIEDYSEESLYDKEKPPKKPKKKSTKTKQKKTDNTNKNTINYLSKNNGYEYEKRDKQKYEKLPRFPLIIITIILILSSLGIIGYVNTDFDNNGTPYTIPLDIHYKRKYAMISDEVLNLLNDFDDKIESYIKELPKNYLSTTDTLNSYLDTLSNKTNNLSRYTNVPKEFSAYNSSILNFSILTQEYINNLISNYSNNDYYSFAKNGLTDFRSYLKEVNSLRKQMDSLLFKNMEV